MGQLSDGKRNVFRTTRQGLILIFTRPGAVLSQQYLHLIGLRNSTETKVLLSLINVGGPDDLEEFLTSLVSLVFNTHWASQTMTWLARFLTAMRFLKHSCLTPGQW